MLRYFGQPKFKVTDADKLPISYEFLIRERENADERWHLPEDFNALTPAIIEPLLNATIATLPAHIKHISFNLELTQFVDPTYAEMVARIQQQTDVHVITEVTERQDFHVTTTQFMEAAADFYARNLAVALDDIGLDGNSLARLYTVLPSIEGFKYPLQNLRPFSDFGRISTAIKYWAGVASHNNKLFAVEGIETKDELDNLRALYPYAYVQAIIWVNPSCCPSRMIPNTRSCKQSRQSRFAALRKRKPITGPIIAHCK